MENTKDETILIGLPNLGKEKISLSVVSNWEIEVDKEIGNTLFCWSDGTYISIEREDYERVLKYKEEQDGVNS